MRFTWYLIAIMMMTLAIMGCGGSGTSMTSTDAGDVPAWFVTPPVDPNFLYAPKTAVSSDMQMSIDKAANEGRAELARELEVRVNGIEKRFREEVGVGDNAQYLEQFTTANKQVVASSLNGSRIKEQLFVKDGNDWRGYVLMELPLGVAKEAMLENIKKNEQIYTRFRSTQVFKELDDEVKKYEEWKKENNVK